MKKLLFTLCLLTGFIASAHAQTEHGTILIGGSGALHFDTEGPNRSTLISLTPRVGYFAANNFALGASIPIQYNINDAQTTYSAGLAPFARVYFGSSATKFLIEGRGGYNRLGVKFEENWGGIDYSQTNGYFTFGFGAGVSHFLNEYVGLELMLNYNRADVSSLNFSSSGLTGVTFNLGFQIHLPGSE